MIDLTSPNTVAFLQFLGLGLLGVLAAFGQWFGKRKESSPAGSKDVVVPSLAIADNAAITHLAETLREANRVAQTHREHDTEMLYELKAIKESLHRLESMMGRGLDLVR
ncbi:MAG TPA: hypothetical protein VEZ24_09155 [Microvirga sp.]|nr:hypothetical protein [Microvirga sp.]